MKQPAFPSIRFDHECPSCRYLGTGLINGEQTDWWLCSSGSMLGRYGDAPHEYWSMPVAMLKQASANGSTYASAALDRLSCRDAQDALRQAGIEVEV